MATYISNIGAGSAIGARTSINNDGLDVIVVQDTGASIALSAPVTLSPGESLDLFWDGAHWQTLGSENADEQVTMELSGQAEADGYSQPTTDVVNVYVMSEVQVQLPDPQPTLGDDNNDGLTKSTPLRTMDGVRKMIGRRGVAGKRFVIHLAGGGYPAVADPWDGQCTSIRYYLVRDLFVGGSEAFEQSWSVRGPRKMLVTAGPITVTSFAGDGLRTRWDTSADLGLANALRGQWLRVTRGVNGYEVTQPVQITGNSGSSFWTDNGPNTMGAVYETTDTYNIVSCAAELVSTNEFEGDVGAADGVAAQGFGASDVHARPSAGVNPRLTFERIAFERFNSSGVAGLSFGTCLFYNTTTFRGGWIELNGCIVNADNFTWLASSRTNGNSSETNEFNGRAIIPAVAPYPDVAADPMWPERGGIGLYVTRGGMRVGAEHERGIFRIWKSLSVEGPVIVHGRGSSLVQSVNVGVLFIRNAGGVGLHARNGGVAIVNDANGLVEIAAASQLKVGIGAGIALGTGAGAFREVGQWAGNFSRHLEVNAGGKPTGDDSRICESAVWF